jgi:catechol 2,3-dioxygenase
MKQEAGKGYANKESSSSRFRIHPSTKIGYVSLNVSDIEKSLEFYQSLLGFRKVAKSSNDRALLSSDGNPSHLVELLQANQEGQSNSRVAKKAGLSHLAILLPERKHLADMLRHLSDKRDQVYFDGLADHLVSEAIYIRDPDFNGIEIYRDRPYSEWKWNRGDRADNNKLQMATLQLNTDDLLKESTKKGWVRMPAKTIIGHVHLHVGDLSKAIKFYHEILGLNLTTTYPGAYFFAAGIYHHHIATNAWLGTKILAASPESVGLNHFSIELPNREEFDRMVKQLSRYNMAATSSSSLSSKSILIHDPNGIRIQVYYHK